MHLENSQSAKEFNINGRDRRSITDDTLNACYVDSKVGANKSPPKILFTANEKKPITPRTRMRGWIDGLYKSNLEKLTRFYNTSTHLIFSIIEIQPD